MFKNCMSKCPERNGWQVRKFLKGHQVSLGMKQWEWKPWAERSVGHLPGTHGTLGAMPSTERSERFTFPFYLLLVCQEQRALATCSLPPPGAWGQATRTEPSKTRSQNKPLLGKWSLTGGQERPRQKDHLTQEGKGSGDLGTCVTDRQHCHSNSFIRAAAPYQRKAGCVCARARASLGQRAATGGTSLSEGCFLLDWNCASRDEMGDKRKMGFYSQHGAGEEKEMKNAILVSKVK